MRPRLAFAPVPPRILIVTASVGEGHDAPARALAEQLRLERPEAEILTEDCLAVMGPAVSALSEGAARVVFYRFLWMWDVAFWLFAVFPPTRALTQFALTRFGSRGLLELIAARQPDLVVSVYPNATEVLGRLRRAGKLRVPLCAVVTDVAGLHYWATPGADLHLVTHPESVEEVRSIAGPDAEVHCVHGFTKPAFLVPSSPSEARLRLGLDAEARIVLVSGGGWGVGAIEQTVNEVLGVAGVGQVVCLCGRNEELRRRLLRRFSAEPRVRVEGFTDRMADWLAAADALVHSTGGLTVLEALMQGCPAISYGWGRGHVRLHNAAFRRFGLAEVAGTPAGLRAALAATLARGRSGADFSTLPSAASFVLARAEQARLADAA
jgi:UDP-N-acetylglucosamine:LPS N-acetylglucosamine transferase